MRSIPTRILGLYHIVKYTFHLLHVQILFRTFGTRSISSFTVSPLRATERCSRPVFVVDIANREREDGRDGEERDHGCTGQTWPRGCHSWPRGSQIGMYGATSGYSVSR